MTITDFDCIKEQGVTLNGYFRLDSVLDRWLFLLLEI